MTSVGGPEYPVGTSTDVMIVALAPLASEPSAHG